MNRIRRIANELLQKYPDRFTADYEKNKQALNEIAEFRSKYLRNKLAGYIARKLKRSQMGVEQ